MSAPAPALKRSRSGRPRKTTVTLRMVRPEGCPLTCPVKLWNYLLEKQVWSVVQQQEEGPGPWEIRPYQGPAEALIGTERYVHLQRQFQRNEKRRIAMRVREIERFIHGKSWTGPEPSAAEIAWANHLFQEREERRRSRSNRANPPTVHHSSSVDPLGLEWQDPYLSHTQIPLTPVSPEDFPLTTDKLA